MPRTLADSRVWSREGTALVLSAVGDLPDDGFAQPTSLPGWTRRHVTGHLAANADALRNLVHWAATGDETPMYPSPEARAAGIECAVTLPADELREWLATSVAALAHDLDALSDEQWGNTIVTAQGRTVPASEIPWMRAREVCVHAVDLDLGISFADLPEAFLAELVEEIRAKRGLDELPEGPLPEVAAWLTGRPHALADAPDLGPWL